MHRNESYRYCPLCGKGLVKRTVKKGEPKRLVCGACGFVFYLDPKLAACVIVEIEGEILMVKRGISPGAGMWVIPGGFVDVGERVHEAARREAREETGLDVETGALVGVYSYEDSSVAVIVYEARVTGGELIAGDETLEAKLFAPSDIPWADIPFSSTTEALRDYLAVHYPGLLT